MVDFKRLAAQTPEERDAHLKRMHEEFEARTDAQVRERTVMVEALRAADWLEDHERRFVEDLHYRATTYNIGGLFGGRLAELSDKQLRWLQALHERLQSRQQQAAAGDKNDSPYASLVRDRRG